MASDRIDKMNSILGDLRANLQEIEAAVLRVLEKGYRTGDIMQQGMKLVGTKEMGRLVREEI